MNKMVPIYVTYDYVQASLLAQTVKNLSAMRETQVRPLGQEDALEKGMATPLVFLPGEFLGQRNTVHGVAKSRTRLSD